MLALLAELDWETIIVGTLQIAVILIVSYLGHRKAQKVEVKINGNLEQVRREARKLGDAEGHERGMTDERRREQ